MRSVNYRDIMKVCKFDSSEICPSESPLLQQYFSVTKNLFSPTKQQFSVTSETQCCRRQKNLDRFSVEQHLSMLCF